MKSIFSYFSMSILIAICICMIVIEPPVNTTTNSSTNKIEMFNEVSIFNENEHCESIEHPTKHTNINTNLYKYQLSKAGKDFIKSYETCVLKAYNDPSPKRRSVGWGHQIQPGEHLETITREKADELFEKDIEWVNAAINRLISKNDNRFIYTQGFIDGLGSLIYNCGERGVTLTEFWSRWQKCRYSKDSINYIDESDFNYTLAAVKTARISAPGHVERRKGEYQLMLN